MKSIFFKSVTICTAALMLSGCAFRTPEGYRQSLQPLVGVTEQELLSQWGIPDQAYEMDGGEKALKYDRSGTSVIPGVTTYHNIATEGYASIPVKQPDVVIQHSCITTFFLSREHKVKSFRFDGGDCKEYEKKAVKTEAEKP